MVMHYNFVTLFDSNYLIRGLTLYESLKSNLEKFKLFIIAFDDRCYKKLKELALEFVVVISLEEFEDEELLNIKSGRTRAEYCWSSTAKSILYVLDNYNLEICTYLDADLYFFDDPQILFEELSESKSVIITEHRYSPYCDQTKTSGKYCVQFMTFKNNQDGICVLEWWKDRCIEWCYSRLEDGKFGDQMYLDDWVERFSGIHELKNIGGGVAPWNVNQYTFKKEKDKIYLIEKETNNLEKLVFYHFHNLEFFDKDVVHLSGSIYDIPDTAIVYVYKEYIKKIEMVCCKYNLNENRADWIKINEFRDNDMDKLLHENNYYHYSIFI